MLKFVAGICLTRLSRGTRRGSVGYDVGSPKNDRPDIIDRIEEPAGDDPEATLP